MTGRKGRNLALRRFVPSVAKLTYNPLFGALLSVADVVPGKLFREFGRLPPNRMRARVGVGNRIFTNQVMYLLRGYPMWMYALARGYVDFDSDIVEIGCGIGRRSHVMRDFRFHDVRFTGSYLGIDIDPEMIAWCRANFDDRFEFALSSHPSEAYRNADANNDHYYVIPRNDTTIDFVFSTSLLSHLLEPQIRNYFAEGARILKPGGRMMMSFFAIDLNPKLLDDRYTFSHRMGPAYVESLEVPEAAIAYESAWMIAAAREAGFQSAEVLHDPADVQQMLVAQA
jgi:SAM-dependent methyltransferase